MEWLRVYRGVTETASVILLVLYCFQLHRTWGDLFCRDGGVRRMRAYVIAIGTAASVLQVFFHVDSFACFQIYSTVAVALFWSFTSILLSTTLYITSYQLVSTTFGLMYDPTKRQSAQRKWKMVMAGLIVFHSIWLIGRSLPHGYPYEMILWAAFIVGSFNLVTIAAVTYRRLRSAVAELQTTQSAIHVTKLSREVEEKLMKNVRLWRTYLIYLILLSIFSTMYFSFQIRYLLLARQTRVQNGEEFVPFFFAPGSICDGTQSPEDFRVSIPGNIFLFTEIMCQLLMLSITAIMLYRHWKNTRNQSGESNSGHK